MVVRPQMRMRGVRETGLWIRGIRSGLRGGLSTPALRRTADRIGKILLDEIAKSSRRSFQNPSGALARSFKAKNVRKGPGFDVRIVTNKPYARIQDRGGIIRPKRARKLTIPLTARAKGRRARDFPRLHRRGNALFQGREALFALASQVRIRPTRYLQKALRNARARIRRELGKGLRDLSRGARRV